MHREIRASSGRINWQRGELRSWCPPPCEKAFLLEARNSWRDLGAIDAIVSLGRDDRLGSRLRDRPLAIDETAALDIEVWYSGAAQSRERVGEIMAAAVSALNRTAAAEAPSWQRFLPNR